MKTLNELITTAMQLAAADGDVAHNMRLWKPEGGRRCPLGWEGCSQTVYVDLTTDEYDYGDPDGPAHADCVRCCPHGFKSPPVFRDGCSMETVV